MPNHTLRALNDDERIALETQYNNTPDPSESFSASGEHYILTMILNKLGFYPNGRDDAYKLADDLLMFREKQ